MLDLDSILPARTLGISRLSPERGHLGLDLAKNTNDKATAFAGSIFSLAALSGYDTAYRRKEEEGVEGDLFLLTSEITYQRPGLKDLTARSVIVEDLSPTRRGNYKITIRVEVCEADGGSACAAFKGAYVIRVDAPVAEGGNS